MSTTQPTPHPLSQLWNSLPGLYWVVNDELVLIAVSDDYLQLLETSRADVLDRDIAELFRHQPHTLPDGSIASLRQHLEEVRRTGQEQRLTAHPASDPERIFDLVYRPVPGENQSVAYIIGQATEQRFTEEALRQSEEHLQLIMQSAIDYAIFTLNLDRKITRWNAGATQLTGWTEEEVLGQGGDIVFTPEDRENNVVEKEVRVATQEGHFANERWHVRKDGSRFWGSGFTVPLRTAEGQVRGFLKIMRDDTERRRTQAALQQAKEVAEQAARAKADFLAHMSHEIRTPLNAVVGLANLLLQQETLPRQEENLQTLKFSADNLRLLVDDILDFSKIQAGKVAIEETEVRLPELLSSLQNAHQPRTDEQGTVLQFHTDPQLPEVVRTDALKLSQVLNNLVNNALKFTQEGEVTVNATLNRRENDKLWLNFSVQDTGIGIPPDKLATIFDAFTQADNSTVRQYGGTGLGLSITRSLLELMDSRIEVESEVGKGSRFFFTLPVKREAEAAVPTSTNVAVPTVDWDTLKVLLVEDVAVNRMIFEQFLRQWGLSQLDEATNGQEAVAMAERTPYDLILMDVRMPVMDGYQATRAIRSLPHDAYRQVPIIALTADTVDEIKKHTESPLFTDVITKPFVPEDAQRKIIRHLSSVAPASDIPPVQVSLKKLNKLFEKDSSSIRMFLEEAVREMKDLRRKFGQALSTRDETALVNLNHESSFMLELLTLYDLKDYLRLCLVLVMDQVASELLEEARQRGEAMIDQAIASSEEQLRRMN